MSAKVTDSRKSQTPDSTGIDDLVIPILGDGVVLLDDKRENAPVELTKLEAVKALLRSRSNHCYVGFTSSHKEAPFGDPDWLIAGCNNLWKFIPSEHCQFWFDLHPIEDIRADKEQEAWLQNCKIPVFVLKEQPDWPTSITFPRDDVLAAFPPYFTNTISWQIGLSMAWCYDVLKNLSIYGVDMAQQTEYAKQRPSVEFALGTAYGRGVGLHIPKTSDLLKAAAQYGFEDDSPMRSKMEERLSDLRTRQNNVDNQIHQLNAARHQMQGAIEDLEYWIGTWFSAAASRDGSPKEAGAPE